MVLHGKLQFEMEMKAAADQFYKIFRSQSSHIPNMCSDKIHSIHVEKGDWKTLGSVKEWDYTLDGKDMSVKETIEAADDVNKIIKFKILDGDVMKLYKSFNATVQAIPKELDQGCSTKWTLEYEKQSHDIPAPIAYKEFAMKIVKEIDEHLAN